MEVSRDPDVRFSFARDASGLELLPEGVIRPSTADDVMDAVRMSVSERKSITPAGSQTSMTGASITDSGYVMSMSSMNSILEIDRERRIARVQPGVRIGDLNRALAEHDLLFAPDPTSEEDATIGGAIACNASGARTLYYGPTRNHVAGVNVVHADGSAKWYRRDHPEKNCVGYSMIQDPVDWFVGSEGTLGIVVEAELALVERPGALMGLAVPFASLESALDFVVAAREFQDRRAMCLELFDEGSLAIASSASRKSWPPTAAALVYLEDDAGDGHDFDSLLESWLAVVEATGGLSDDIRAYQGPAELREARIIRHSVPSTMNERGSSFRARGGRKVSTDWAVPYRKLREALQQSAIAIELHGAPAPITYGHAGNGHPHQNFIAEDRESLERIEAAVEDTLRRVIALGGTVSAEHGLGKLKRRWISLQLDHRQIAIMRQLKHALDPLGTLSPGNIID